MKIIIAGSRDITDENYIFSVLDMSPFLISEVVSGGASGVDRVGENYANSYHIPLVIFPADWEHLGKKAGIIRNCIMGDYADALLAIWDGKSRGTRHMIEYMVSLGKPMYVEVIKNKTS